MPASSDTCTKTHFLSSTSSCWLQYGSGDNGASVARAGGGSNNVNFIMFEFLCTCGEPLCDPSLYVL